MAPQQSPADPRTPTAVRAYRALPPHRRRRVDAILGGAAAGLGLGLALAWTLGIFQRANPQITDAAGNTASAYPPMALTVFVVVIIAGLAIGLGMGFVIAALIPEAQAEPGRSAAVEPSQD